MFRNSAWFPAPILPALISTSVILMTTAFMAIPASAAGKRTLTGEVGDAMCGRKHMAGETAAECTRACASQGSRYALIVGEKIYTLDTSDKAALATLDKQAGKMATVVGTVDGDNVTVTSVTAK